MLWVCGIAEALAGDVNGGFSSLQGAGSAGDVCQAPCFFMCYKALLGRVGILEFSEQFLLVFDANCFDANSCPLVGALGLEEDRFWSRTFGTSVWPCAWCMVASTLLEGQASARGVGSEMAA